MSTCNWLDLQTQGSQPIRPKNLPNNCSKASRFKSYVGFRQECHCSEVWQNSWPSQVYNEKNCRKQAEPLIHLCLQNQWMPSIGLWFIYFKCVPINLSGVFETNLGKHKYESWLEPLERAEVVLRKNKNIPNYFEKHNLCMVIPSPHMMKIDRQFEAWFWSSLSLK